MRLYCLLCSLFFLFLCGSAGAQGVSLAREYFYKADYAACIQEGRRLLAGQQAGPRDEIYALVALSALKQGDWRLSSDMFNRLLSEYRRSPYADEARLGIADSLSVQGDLKQARQRYLEFISNRPSSKLKAQAYYRVMLLARKAGDRREEEEYRQKLGSEFPESAEARLDRDIFPPAASAAPVVAPVVAPVTAPLVEEKTEPAIVVSPQAEQEYQAMLAAQAEYSVQVGAFSRQANAASFCDKLKRGGFPAFTDTVNSNGKLVYKVKVGRFVERAEAKKMERRLSSQGYPTKITP